MSPNNKSNKEEKDHFLEYSRVNNDQKEGSPEDRSSKHSKQSKNSKKSRPSYENGQNEFLDYVTDRLIIVSENGENESNLRSENDSGKVLTFGEGNSYARAIYVTPEQFQEFQKVQSQNSSKDPILLLKPTRQNPNGLNIFLSPKSKEIFLY